MAPKRDPPPPIAIIGMGLRLPGGISTPEDFWTLLINKKDAKCRVPTDRYNVDAFFSQKSNRHEVATEYGYFLQNVNLKTFDASFFSAILTELQSLDPQQRLLLEVIWECMENAGQTNLRGTDTGVFVGVFGEDWQNLLHKDIEAPGTYRTPSGSDFMIANRISYEYDFRGPR